MPTMAMAAPAAAEDNREINLQEYWDIVVDNRWLVAAVTALAVAIGGAYAFLAKPVYESNLLIQVEDSTGSPMSFLGEAASLFEMKTAATAEIEIIRSRMVIGQAVDNTRLYISATPQYLPLVGGWLARRSKELSDPGFVGFGGYVTGAEKISVTSFDVPQELEGTSFRLTANADGKYTVTHPDLDRELTGAVGRPLVQETEMGPIRLLVASLEGKPGAEFNLVRYSRLEMIEDLQRNLRLAEKGRQSGVIDARLQDSDRKQLTLILNEIGEQYVKQNVERKAAEAQKTLQFLDVQLPQFKKQLNESEEAYNRYRNRQGTVALDEEAKLVLARTVELQTKLVESQQKRREMIARFTPEHPAVQTLDAQIAAWDREIGSLNARVKAMPSVQQDALRLERDVKVNNELYQQLRNNALQLQLVREGKVGNVRLIDPAATPEDPVKPRRGLTLVLAMALGLLGGVILALARNAFFRGIRNPQEIEAHTGLNVYSTIPLSEVQNTIARQVADKQPGVHVLAHAAPQDVAIESLRSLRTALQFAMLEATNNRVLITGATPGIGKSFVSANLAAVLASAGKRVLLIDADLRKGHLNQYFGIGRASGLSELIAGTLPVDKALRRNVLPQLDFMPTGVLPPNPAELMTSGSFANLLEALSAEYDLVIVDTAPVLAAADTLSVAPHVGTLLLVARAGQTQLGELHESARRLAHAGKHATGVLFNGMDLTRRHYGNYGYKYGAYRYRQYSYGATAK
ncbi:polysaccharide biosynthesis tyrosine autokinase [Ramlibacter henchirensis]|uniref:Putative tyrosine-protein kinase EpsB n=1 Tax=Ramlibacter henchirensis TaxID=204072 RepID=A0A4Z0BYU1_9BURK|nr:polysaccharide biosynthesis tyrosine autokinase [Ramlibacter henchirensis]TFZ03185.1 polysaccharide biosynthesis tyrosine autokinase [Ramlibacter henchirensis]